MSDMVDIDNILRCASKNTDEGRALRDVLYLLRDADAELRSSSWCQTGIEPEDIVAKRKLAREELRRIAQEMRERSGTWY